LLFAVAFRIIAFYTLEGYLPAKEKMTRGKKEELITQFKGSENDTGSAGVQVALLTERIKQLTEHLAGHSQDQSSRRAMMKLIGQRKRFLTYLSKRSPEQYRSRIAQLGLRK